MRAGATVAFMNASAQIGRRILGEVTITDGVNTEVYNDADISLIESYSDTEHLSVGKAFIAELRLKLYQPRRTVAYQVSTITVKLTAYDESSMPQTIDVGVYYANKVETSDDYETLSILAYDVLGKYRDMPYVYGGVTPVTIGSILDDLIDNYGVPYNTKPGRNWTVSSIPEDCTVLDMIGWIAGTYGYNAYVNSNGNIYQRWYPATTADTRVNAAAANSVIIDRGKQHERGLHLNSSTPIEIKSVTAGWGDKVFTAGTGKGITFENPFITAQARCNTAAEGILGSGLTGMTYYTGEVDWFGNLGIQAGERVKVIDKQGNSYDFCCSRLTWTLGSGCSCTLTSIGDPDAEIEFSTEGPTQKLIKNTKNSLQEAIASATKLLGGSTDGVVRFIDTNGDGINDGIEIHGGPSSPNTYLRINQYGLGISKDNGATYTNAITKDGIVATLITSGALNLGGANDDVVLNIYNTAGELIGTWNKNGLQANFNKTYKASDYSTADITRITNIIGGTVSPTTADYTKYDFNNDEVINLEDLIIIRRMLGQSGQTASGDFTLGIEIYIDPTSPQSFKIRRLYTYKDYSGYNSSSDVFGAGANGVVIKTRNNNPRAIDNFIIASTLGQHQETSGETYDFGYNLYANGLLEYWGATDIAYTGDVSTKDITFPIQFSRAPNIQTTLWSSISSSGSVDWECSANNISGTGCTLRVRRPDNYTSTVMYRFTGQILNSQIEDVVKNPGAYGPTT